MGMLGPGNDTLTFVDGEEEVSENQSQDGHELHDDVEGRAGGILEGITDSVTNDSSLVHIGALAVDNTVNLDLAFLDVFLGVVPSTTSVGGRDSKLDGRSNGARKEPC